MRFNLDKSTWARTSFGEVVRNVNITVKDPESAGITRVIAMEHLDPGELKIQRWGIFADGTTFSRRVKPGQTLFGKRRAYQRKVAYADFDAICSGDILVFEADPARLLPELLPFLVQSDGFFDHALGTSAGSLSPRTNWGALSNYEFLLPGLEQQKRIADLLWAVERHRLALASLMSRTKAAATVLIEDVRRRVPETKAVGEVARVHNGQTFPKELQGKTTGEVAFFKVADLDGVGNARFLTNPGNWISESDMERLSAQLLPKGTVVTARVGAAIKLERRRALRWPALVDDNHLVIRPLSVDPDYLLAVLSETALSVNGNDGVVPSLNQRIVGAVPLPAVARHHQQQIGASYQRILDARDELGAELDALVRLRSSLLDGTFGGD